MGELLDAVRQSGQENETIVIFTADNGPEMLPDHQGWSGPWRGSYFTAREGSLRVPFILRWPGKVPANRVSNEIVHQMDLFTTLASIVDAVLPTDRHIDGVDQSAFFAGGSDRSARESFVVYVGEEIFCVKWRNWKMLNKEFDDATGLGKIVRYGVPRFYNLYADPKKSYAITAKPLTNVRMTRQTQRSRTTCRNRLCVDLSGGVYLLLAPPILLCLDCAHRISACMSAAKIFRLVCDPSSQIGDR